MWGLTSARTLFGLLLSMPAKVHPLCNATAKWRCRRELLLVGRLLLLWKDQELKETYAPMEDGQTPEEESRSRDCQPARYRTAGRSALHGGG